MRRLILIASITIVTSCTHTIVLDSGLKVKMADCLIDVVDKRIDRQLIAPQPGTTYSYPIDYPIDQAIENRLCQITMIQKEITVYLEHAKCQFPGGFSKHEAALRVVVKGYATPAVSVKNEDSGSSMIGKHCGFNMNLGIDDVVEQIADITQ